MDSRNWFDRHSDIVAFGLLALAAVSLVVIAVTNIMLVVQGAQ